MIELNILKKIEADTAIVSLEGDLDQPNATAFFDNMTSMFEENNLKNIILDLNSLTFLDSLGLGALVRLQSKVEEASGQLKIVCTKEAVLRVFELSGLWSKENKENRLSVFESIEDTK